MTSLSSSVANFRDSSFYEFGDTVFWQGQVYILNAVSNGSNPYVPGVPPYPGDGIWFNPAGTVVPPLLPPEPFLTFQQTGANWDAEKNYGTVSFSWTGGIPNKGYTLFVNNVLITSPLGYYIDEDTNTGTIYGIGPGAPGTTIIVNIVALAVTGLDTTSAAVNMTTLGPPPAPSIALLGYSIDPDTSKGEVSISFQTNAGLYDVPTVINGYAIGSTNTSGVPDFTFTYDIALGTATFSDLTGVNNTLPPLSFKVFIEGSNSAGKGPISNILEENFNPHPPLPDNLDNIALVTFLLGGGDYSSAGNWSINTGGNQQIGSYNCNTGAFTETVAGDTIRYLTGLQSRGVTVLLSMGGATWNVATGLSDGTRLASNISYAFFGTGSSPDGWVRYGSTLTPAAVFTFDGLDLDWEGVGTAAGTQEINFLTQFRSLNVDSILAMAPQPPYNANTTGQFNQSAFNGNGQYSPFPTYISPVNTFVPSNPLVPTLLDINHLGFFDFIFVQYYNNPDWAPGAAGFSPNVAQWAKMCQSAIPHRDGAGPGLLGTRFVLGLACTDSQTPVYSGATDNPFIQEALVQAQLAIGAETVQNYCAGSGFWNSPTANYPDATTITNPFFQLYNPDNGVVALANTQVIMMYCNASGINPQWQNLPLLNFEEPGLPDIPPVTFTLSTTILASNMSALTVTLPTVPADLIGLQIDIAGVAGAGDQSTLLLRPATLETQTNSVYTMVFGLQNSWWYDVRVKALLPTGTSKESRLTAQFNSGTPAPFFSLNYIPFPIHENEPNAVTITLTANTASAGGIVPDETSIISCWLARTTPVYAPDGSFINAELLPQSAIARFFGIWQQVTTYNFRRDVRVVIPLPYGTNCWISLGVAQPGTRGSVFQTMAPVRVGF